MKFHSFLFAEVAAVAAVEKQAVPDQEIVNTILDSPWLLPRSLYKSLSSKFDSLKKRQLPPVPIATIPTPKKAPKSLLPEVQELKAEAWEGAKRVKVRHGPYRIPPISKKNFQSMVMSVQGMTDTFNVNAKKPCEGECTILALFADLEFADGSKASNASGTWFHHVVLLNSGPNVIEGNCGPSNLTLTQQPKTKAFSEHSVYWQAPKAGCVLGTGGHQHDGAIGTLIFKNDEVICDSQPVYGAAGGHSGMGGMKKRQVKETGYKNTDIAHVLKQNPSNFKDGIALKKGDTMHIQANYDFNKHPGMLNKKGQLDEVMGIVGTLVAF